MTAGTVELNRDAWLSDGRNQISGPQIRYNIVEDRIEATSEGPGKRVHISIGPRTVSGNKQAHAPGNKAHAPGKPGPKPPGRSP